MNKQAAAWAGEFGTEYAKRSPGSVEANVEFFKRALSKECGTDMYAIESVIEFGAGVGNNLRALKAVLPWNTVLQAVEINDTALVQLHQATPLVDLVSMLDFQSTVQWDLAFTKGLLIHIAPADLPRAYEVLYKASKRYILIAEYFAPVLTEIEYRGRRNMLWKGPHAYDMLDKYPDLKLVDYGFVSSRDPHPQDDLNFWLLEKNQ